MFSYRMSSLEMMKYAEMLLLDSILYRNIIALCFVIHFNTHIPFSHWLWCCSYPLFLLNLGPIRDRGQTS